MASNSVSPFVGFVSLLAIGLYIAAHPAEQGATNNSEYQIEEGKDCPERMADNRDQITELGRERGAKAAQTVVAGPALPPKRRPSPDYTVSPGFSQNFTGGKINFASGATRGTFNVEENTSFEESDQ